MPRTRTQQSAKVDSETTAPEMEVPGDTALQGGSGSAGSPVDIPPASVGGFESGEMGADAPSATPPESAQQAFGATTWHSDKRVAATWSINQNRNSWIYINGIGWKRLAMNSDSAIVALTMIGSHAKQTQCRVELREESDGLIHEIYAW